MSAERWLEIERIFFDARAIPPARRDDFVASACGEDRALRREVQDLLTADDRSGEFLARPALDQLAPSFEPHPPTFEPGMRIGAYTIVGMLGSGGAGEVWRARDERLNRDVAIKTLLPHLAADKERLRHFTEEARTAGTLNDANILTVYDVGEHEGTPLLIAECLEGRTLRARLAAGPLPVREAVSVALQIARGLTAAHAHRIVHRDLKPENVFVKTDGGVKLLDFGIAKLERPLDGVLASPAHTMSGAIVGTVAYMAPEQINGAATDARTDLFAVGVMLYEMLSGQHPFKRGNSVATLHAILTAEPTDLAEANPAVPDALVRIVRRLLHKEPAARFQGAADLAWALEQPLERAGTESNEGLRRNATRSPSWRAWSAMAAAAVGVAAAVLLWQRSPPAAPTELTRFSWTLPEPLGLDSAPAVAPDGRSIAFVARDATGSRLFVRELGSLEPRAVAGSSGARQPFWSPDGASLGFFAAGRLMRVAWPSGAPTPIAAAPESRGAAWSAAGTIVFAPDVILSGLSRVRAEGGASEPATILDTAQGDTSHWWPVALPDGVHFLYFVGSMDDDRRGIYLGRLDRPAAPAGTPLLRSDSGAVFAQVPGSDDGVLLYRASGHVEARKLDMKTLRVADDAQLMSLPAAPSTLWQPMMLSVSGNLLAFTAEAVPNGVQLEAVGRGGESLRIWADAEAQNWPRLSPDQRQIVRQRVDWRNSPDLWVEDLERGTRYPLTTAVEPDIFPVWSPDGRHIAYVTGNLPGRSGQRRLRVTFADGSGLVQELPCPGEHCEPTDWSSDGSTLLVNVLARGNWDVWSVSLAEAATKPLLAEPFNERGARFSPDGRAVAYVSEESGRPEVFIRSLGAEPRRLVVSADGGAEPVWRADGRELFFVDPTGQLLSAAVTMAPDGLVTVAPAAPLAVPPVGFGHWGTQYDVSRDGTTFYYLRRNDAPLPRQIELVVGWHALLD